MNEHKTAINDLWLVAQTQEYYSKVSHSCVKDFASSYPKNKVNTFVNEIHCVPAEFIKDELVWDGKVFGGSKKI